MPPFRSHTLSKPVFFVGFMGAGKSSVVASLSQSLGIASCDTDQLVEQAAGMPIARIFETQGEEAFRNLESAQLEAVAQGRPLLVSCGGGVVEREGNVHVMRRCGFVVCLQASFEEVAKRIGDNSARPLFADVHAARALAARREPLYQAAAHARIDTAGRTVAQVARNVQDVLESQGILEL